jgi:16S rRNA processing protein RimM
VVKIISKNSDDFEFIETGRVVKTQGLRGEVRVHSSTDFPEIRYAVGNSLKLFRDGKPTLDVVVRSYRRQKNLDIVGFAGYDSINNVEEFVGGALKIAKSDQHELDDDEFYYHEIVGLKIVDEESGELLGTVSDVMNLGSNDVWTVKRRGAKDFMLPFIESVVKKVDVKKGEALVEIPEGLID